MRPLLLGLTGTVGSGKSTVAGFLAARGAKVVSGDELGRIVVESSQEIINQIRNRFGDVVFDPDGALNRRALGRLVFDSQTEVRWLTQLTFPAIYGMWREVIAHSKHDIIVLDAALIIEWGIQSEFAMVICVVASEKAAIERLVSTAGLTDGEIRARLASQLSWREKASLAHVVIENDGSIEELRLKVDVLWNDRIQPLREQRRN